MAVWTSPSGAMDEITTANELACLQIHLQENKQTLSTDENSVIWLKTSKWTIWYCFVKLIIFGFIFSLH